MPTCRVSCAASVFFTAHEVVGYGDKLCVVGNHKALGRWDLRKAFELRWNEGDIWKGGVELPDSESVEFKLVKVKGIGNPVWETGDNRTLHINNSPVAIKLVWNAADCTVVEQAGRTTADKEGRSDVDSPCETGSSPHENDASSASESIAFSSSGSSSEEDAVDKALERITQSTWQGKETKFMQQNEHSKDRKGTWNSEGLDGTSLFIVKGDEKAGRYVFLSHPDWSQCSVKLGTQMS
jgi:hypothetical protein